MMKKKWQMPQEFRFYCRFQESQVFFCICTYERRKPVASNGGLLAYWGINLKVMVCKQDSNSRFSCAEL